MGFRMAALLAHSEQVSSAVRDVLREAQAGAGTGDREPERRLDLLESAARILHAESGIDCADARELVDLDPGDGCY